MKKILVCLVAIVAFNWLIYPVEVDLSQKTPVNSAIRSAIFPGWGQYFNNQKTKGYILMGSEVISLSATILLFNQAEATYQKYEEKGVKDDPLYDEYSKQMDYVYAGTILSVGIWVYAIVDAYLVCDSQLKGKTASVFKGVILKLNKGALELGYKILF